MLGKLTGRAPRGDRAARDLLLQKVVDPTPPANFGIVKLTASSLTLSWIDNAENEEGFKIERRIGTGGVWQRIATVSEDDTSYEDTGLSGTELHFYRIRAYNREGDSDYTSDVSAFLRPGDVYELTPWSAGTDRSGQSQ